MRISQELQSKAIKQIHTNIDSKKSFDAIVQSQTYKLKQQEIQHLIKEITDQGDKLARFRSFPDLVKFKRLVKGFLNETIYNGLDLQKMHHFSLEGQSHELAIVKEVDNKLMELTEELMNQEKKTVDLLAIIGEIKGLLFNLYT